MCETRRVLSRLNVITSYDRMSSAFFHSDSLTDRVLIALFFFSELLHLLGSLSFFLDQSKGEEIVMIGEGWNESLQMVEKMKKNGKEEDHMHSIIENLIIWEDERRIRE